MARVSRGSEVVAFSQPDEKPEQELQDSTRAVAAVARETGVSIGTVVEGEAEDSSVRVQLDRSQADPCEPRSLVALGSADVGRQVLVAFEEGDPTRPVVLGFLHDPRSQPPTTADSGTQASPISVEADGERVTIDAKKEIVLRCGKATITLTRAGKILIRGAYLLSRSSGVNRIKGGSIQLN